MNIYVWSVILGGCIVTLLPRVLPITILSKVKLNKKVEEILTYIPISILVALKKNNLLLTVGVGIISVAILRFVF